MRLRYTDRAKDDLELAFAWYERQRNGLGLDFLGSIEAALTLILENPEIWPVSHSVFRSCSVRRFPFALFYTLETAGDETREEIVIHAVFNTRQDPDKKPL